MSTLPLPDLEAEVDRLRGLHAQGEYPSALAGVRSLTPGYPENRDLLLLEASSLRHLGRVDEALVSLLRLEAAQPRYSLMHQERGLCHIARRDAPEAIAALLAAVNLNPALPMAWKMLEGVYRLTGDADNAATAAAHVETLQALPEAIVRATSLFSDGELSAAEQIVRAFLLQHHRAGRPDHPEAMRLLARIGMAREVWDDAELLLGRVLEIAPDYRAARIDYASTLTKRHKYAEAETALAPLLVEEPGNTEFRTLASTIAVGLGRHDEAIARYRELIAELPEAAPAGGDPRALASTRADLNLWLGHALKTVGELEPAVAAYRASTAARPDFGDAWWSLANLKTFRFTDAEMAAMRSAEANAATSEQDRVHLAFALGKAHADRGDFAQGWQHYAAGNAMQRMASRYRPEIIETNATEQRRICTPGFFAERKGWGCPDPAPIFVLGLPRAGSTLIEQILASHRQVEGTQELPYIQRLALELLGRDPDLDNPAYPAALADLTAAQCRAMGERYLRESSIHRATGRPFFVDKMPNNFRHIGLIRLILPNATIIDARREPMACCLSNLTQLFAQGQEFTYSAEDIARYYRSYLALMRHWDMVLPGAVLRVLHEDVVDDVEGQVRRILAHCGLDYDPACLAFHETRRAVRTPSSEQVRQPIYRQGLDHWRNFEPWLAPLKEALGDALADWRD